MAKFLFHKLPSNVPHYPKDLDFYKYLQNVFTVTAAGMAVIAFGALSTINHESSLPFGSMSVLVLAIALFILDILKQRSYAFFLYTILYGAFFGVIFKNDISSFTKVFLNILFLYLSMGICLRLCKPKLTSYKFFFLIGLISCAFTILFGWVYGFSIAEIIISLVMVTIFTSFVVQRLPRIHAYYSH